MQSYLKKGIHLTMNRLLNDYQRQMILEQLDVVGKGKERSKKLCLA